MSMPDKNKVKFGARVAVHRDEISESKIDILRYRRERQAEDLGRLIAETKGWRMEPFEDMAISSLDLYVFTKTELWDYTDAKIKQKLIEMSNRDGITPTIKEALLLLSERV